MKRKWFGHGLFLAVALILVAACGCRSTGVLVADESYIFPATPTFPAAIAVGGPTATPFQPTGQGEQRDPGTAARTAIAAVDAATLPPPTVTPTLTPTLSPTPLPTATPCQTPGSVELGQFESPLAGTMTYRVYLPPCYSALGRTYPALYMLPGNIYTDSIWDELGLDEAAEQGIREERYPPLLLVMVSGGQLANFTSGGPFSYETFFMEEFVPYIEDTYCAWPDPQGRAIGGMSRGGYWALEIAFRHAQEFVSAAGHSAALLDNAGGPEIDPMSTGMANDLDDLRIYMDIGRDDWVIYNVQQLHEQMLEAGRDHLWVLNEGQHEEAYWSAHLDDYLDWYMAPWQDKDLPYPPCRTLSSQGRTIPIGR